LRWGSACLASLVALSAIALGACQSSQEKSAELEKSGHNAISKEKGLQITAVNKQVKVLDTTTLTDKNGSAVVVTLKNESSQGLINTPIAIDVQDAKGKSVFKNNDPGLEASLIGVPLMQAGQTVDWVNDQVLAAGTPKSVKVQVGSTKDTLSSSVPELEVSKPKLKTDPYSGTEAAGTVTNKSGIDQTRLILFAVPAMLISRMPGFEIRELWYLSVGSIVFQMCVNLLLLRHELRKRLRFDEPENFIPASATAS